MAFTPTNLEKSRLVKPESSTMRWRTSPGTLPAMARSRTKSNYSKAFLDMIARAGFASPNALAVAAGRPHALGDLARGKSRTLRADSLAALAEALNQPMEAVARALDLPDWPAEPTRAPIAAGEPLAVRYVVQAGWWSEVDNMAQARLKSPPVTASTAFPESAQWLELVRGDSADLYYPEGSWVHVVDAIVVGYAPRDGDFVVVERRREQGGLIERSLKQIAKKGRRIELWPRSRNPDWNAPLRLDEGDDGEMVVEIAALVIGGYSSALR